MTDEEKIAAAVAAGKVRRFGPGTWEDHTGTPSKAAEHAAKARKRNRRIGSRQNSSLAEGEARQRAAADAIRFS